jgi:hypothetical protein
VILLGICVLLDTVPNHLLHLFHCHLSIALVLVLRVRIFVHNGRDDEELASHRARAMVFDANTTLPVIGAHVTENITWTNNLGGCRIPYPNPPDGSNLLGSTQCLIATSR